MTIKHIEFDDKASLQEAFKRAILEELEKPCGEGPCLTILPGGSTPLAVYAEIVNEGAHSASCRALVLSDERMVPSDHEDSNYRSIRPMAEACGIADERIISPTTDLPLKDAATDFDQRLRVITEEGATVDSCFLGLGTDGHTASLFPDMDIPSADDPRFAVPAPKESGPSRISITPRLIHMAKQIIFLVSGSEKTEMTNRLLQDPESIPAGVAVRGHQDVQIWSCLS